MKNIIYDYISSSKFTKLNLSQFEEIFGNDIENILEQLVVEGDLVKEDEYYIKFNNQYIKGIIRVNTRGYGFIDNDYASFYIDENDLNTAIDGDMVVAEILTYGEKSSAKILYVLERNITELVGIIRIKNKILFYPDNQKINSKIKITNYDQFKLVDLHKVLVKIDRYEPILEAHIEKIIGHKNEAGVDIASILLDHGIELEFNDKVLQEISMIDETIKLENRKDLRELLTITIDGEDAKDLDDAISLFEENNQTRLFVHIADVTHYVSKDSAIDLSARKRATSVYVADRVVPMLPHFLSNGICSLHPNVDRYTITCEILFNKRGEIVEYDLYPSIINSNYRMSYNDVNKMLNGNMELITQYEDVYYMVSNAQRLSDKITNIRQQQGAIDFDTKEAKIEVNDKGKVQSITIRERNKIHRLIENFMVAANECVAEFLNFQSIPALYRVHLAPEENKIRDFISFLRVLDVKNKINVKQLYSKALQQILLQTKHLDSYPVISKTLLRSMQKAYYDVQPLGHFGLSLENYTHFTSPIRRYPDLIVHRQLKKYFFAKQYDEITQDESLLMEIAPYVSKKERDAIEAEREVESLKKCEYMQKYIGKYFKGVISGIQNFGMFVELENTVEGLIRLDKRTRNQFYNEKMKQLKVGNQIYKIGDSVKVKVIAVDIVNKTIDFELVEKGKKRYEKNRRSK